MAPSYSLYNYRIIVSSKFCYFIKVFSQSITNRFVPIVIV